MRSAIFPGTFDPVTMGHLDLIERGLKMFDRIIVAVSSKPDKDLLFSVEERVEMIREATKGMKNVEVSHFSGLLVDYARKAGIEIVIRGLRAVSDFEYEFQMALMNRKLSGSIEAVFLMPSEQYSYLNSTVVKEIARMGGNVSELVPPSVATRLKERLG
ncbi:MAG: pantetheine-phosphate adenylyltransferase [Candidatus Eisenbacteria bacterium]|nr:pantetheine-phosphate adenylyltransferase [Candidatus Eisenbacteria bacterium]